MDVYSATHFHGNRLHPPDVGYEFGFDEDVQTYSHHLLSCQEFVGCVSGEDLLQLCSPLLTIG